METHSQDEITHIVNKKLINFIVFQYIFLLFVLCILVNSEHLSKL